MSIIKSIQKHVTETIALGEQVMAEEAASGKERKSFKEVATSAKDATVKGAVATKDATVKAASATKGATVKAATSVKEAPVKEAWKGSVAQVSTKAEEVRKNRADVKIVNDWMKMTRKLRAAGEAVPAMTPDVKAAAGRLTNPKLVEEFEAMQQSKNNK